MKSCTITLLLFLAIFSQLTLAQDKSKIHSVLWKIESPSHQTSYLLGTNHLFGDSWITAHKKIDSLLNLSNIFMCEITTADSAPNSMKSDAVNAAALFGEDFKKVNDYFVQETGEGLTENLDTTQHPVQVLNTMTHYLLNKTIEQYGLSPGNGLMDEILLQRAKTNGMECVQLDDFKVLEQIPLLTTIDRQKIKSIVDMVDHLTDTASITKKAALDNDLKDLKLYSQGKSHFNFNSKDQRGEQLAKAITRNQLWMQIIPTYLARGKVFIAVGIRHLDGKQGLVVQLKKKGYKVSPLNL